MRAGTAILISGITLSMLISCTSSDGPGGPWQGTITEEDGVRTVSNPDVPLYGEISWELEAELVLGSDENDENTLFHEARRMLVDSAGNMYVLDSGNFRIQKFDPQGQHLLTIGQEGQGPGEFEDLPAAFISPDETLYAVGGGRLQRFKADGTLLSSLPLTHRLVNLWIAPDHTIYGVETRNSEEGRRRFLVKLDPEGKELAAMAEFSDVQPADHESDGARMRFVILHGYNHFLYLSRAPQGGFFYAFSADYTLFHCTEHGEIDLIIKKEAESIPISQQEKDAIIEGIRNIILAGGRTIPDEVLEQGCQFPAARPYFVSLVTDDRGRLYVRELKSTLDESDTQFLDVFGPDGQYLYRIVTEVAPQVITRGLVYELEENQDEGTILLKRHRILNWDSIKAGIR
jgi:hypothetical protein